MCNLCYKITITNRDKLHRFKKIKEIKTMDIENKIILFVDIINKKSYIGFAISNTYIKIMSNVMDMKDEFVNIIKNSFNGEDYIKIDDEISKNYDFTILIENLTDYINIIKSIHREGMVFRGQYSEKWELKPSVFRSNNSEETEKKIYDDLQQWNNEIFSTKDILCNACNMQHYGIPTRLIDWTMNPLNALFFAATDISNVQENAKIICVQPNIVYDDNSDEYELIRKFIKYRFSMKLDDGVKIENVVNDLFRRGTNSFFIKTKYFNDRIKNQQGIFSISVGLNTQERANLIKQSNIKKVKNIESVLMKVNLRAGGDMEELKKYITDTLKNQNSTDKIVNDIIQYFSLRFGIGNSELSLRKVLFKCITKEEIEDLSQKSFEESLKQNKVFKIIIPCKIKKQLVNDLELVGVTGRVIYPDVQGLSEYMKQKYCK